MISVVGQQTLMTIARQALSAAVNGRKYTPADPGAEELRAACGCFVTYKTRGELRGCLGCFTASGPLYLTVAEYAHLSATQDYRFAHHRLRPEELDAVVIDISVLSPLEPCAEPEKIRLGVHGIYLTAGGRSGCFLPQVATETGWSVAEFWSYCCSHKAGLPAAAWQSGEAQLYTFTAQVIDAKTGTQTES